jgi:hypothetical protein
LRVSVFGMGTKPGVARPPLVYSSFRVAVFRAASV